MWSIKSTGNHRLSLLHPRLWKHHRHLHSGILCHRLHLKPQPWQMLSHHKPSLLAWHHPQTTLEKAFHHKGSIPCSSGSQGSVRLKECIHRCVMKLVRLSFCFRTLVNGGSIGGSMDLILLSFLVCFFGRHLCKIFNRASSTVLHFSFVAS